MSDHSDGTVSLDQHNKLVSHYQRALGMFTPEQREAFRAARPDAPEQAATPQWEPGTQLIVDENGQLAEYQLPQPQNPNAQSYLGRGADPTRRKGDDGSAEWARNDLLSKLGGTPEPKGWLR